MLKTPHEREPDTLAPAAMLLRRREGGGAAPLPFEAPGYTAAPPREALSGPSAPLDTSALAAQQAAEAAAAAAQLQAALASSSLFAPGGGPLGAAPAAAAAAASAAATAAAAAAMLPSPSSAAAAAPAAAAAMLNINVCSTALAALAPRVADLATLNSEFASILEQTDDCWAESHCSEGAAAANAWKNRYVNVLPYDANRVPLDPAVAAARAAEAAATCGHPGSPAAAAVAAAAPPAAAPRGGACGGGGSGSAARGGRAAMFDDCGAGRPGERSYFNGSFIWDPTLDGAYACGYVATQGPLPATVADFWQAMRAARCSAVVMLTNYVDYGRDKCAPYFPESDGEATDLPGGTRVKCVHKTQLSSDIVARRLEVSYAAPSPDGGEEERVWVNHYHVTSWPDHGVPPSTAGVRRLCHTLDDCRRAGARIAVHCSAGVGRTGAFLAVDMLLQRLQRLRLRPPGAACAGDVRSAVDVSALVLALRRQRRGMVQTGAQYEFIYHALMDDLKEGIEAGQEMMMSEAEAEEAAARRGGGGGGGGGAGGSGGRRRESPLRRALGRRG